MTHACALLLLVTLAAQPSAAQPAEASGQRGQPERPTRPASPAVPATEVQPSRFTPFTVASTVFDTNINHSEDDLNAYGMTLGAGVIFRNDPRRPTLEVQ